MKETKIDWCDSTINPVVGCKRGCPYCYAKKINDRFHIIPDFTKPELKPNCLAPLTNKTPKSIFADSMSDPEYWTEEQTAKVIDWMKKSNFNHFILLTKSPRTVNDIRARKDAKELFDRSKQKLFLGYSCGSLDLVRKAWNECPNANYDSILDEAIDDGVDFLPDFLSIEPLTEDITVPMSGNYADLVCKAQRTLKAIIIGAETGNRKGKVGCKREWVEKAVSDSLCTKKLEENCRVFMKSSLKEIMGEAFRQDRLPWTVAKNEKAQKEGE